MKKTAQWAVQPPSGGCVLKLVHRQCCHPLSLPAAFGRLCVETNFRCTKAHAVYPAAFRRLCVETHQSSRGQRIHEPAAFRRLCVETGKRTKPDFNYYPAAFRRLCVETSSYLNCLPHSCQPPSGGCVLKRSDIGNLKLC